MGRIGDILTNVVADEKGDEMFTFSKVTKWMDGSDMNDGKVDNTIFIKSEGEYFKRNFSGPINVKWFGAKGDANYVNKNPGPNYGKAYVDENMTILATDDTEAFRKANDLINTLSSQLFERTSFNLGYRQKRCELYIPPGGYYVTQPEVFSLARITTQFVDSSFFMSGSGVGNSIIIFSNFGDTSKYFIDNNNKYANLRIEGVSIVCGTGNELVYHEDSAGVAGGTVFRDCSFSNYKILFDFNGAANADRARFEKVIASSSVPGSRFFRQNNNTQALGHNFDHCSIAVTDGVVFENNSGGLHNAKGCTFDLFGNSLLLKIAAGADIGEQLNPAFTFIANKWELHDTSMLFDISGAAVNVYSENMTVIFSTAPYKAILRGNLASLTLNDCQVGSEANFQINPAKGLFKVAMVSTELSVERDAKQSLVLNNCVVTPDFIKTSISYFSDDALTSPMQLDYNMFAGSFPRVALTGCKTRSLSVSRKFEDGSPLSFYGISGSTAITHTAVIKSGAQSWGGLPKGTTPVTFTIPPNCMIKRVGIIKNYNVLGDTGGAPFTWNVVNGNGEVYASLTASTTNEMKNSFTDLWRLVFSDADRTMTIALTDTAATFEAQGMVVVEYF